MDRLRLTRLATSDLRNLELRFVRKYRLTNSRNLTDKHRRYFDKWRGTSDYSPAMDAVATALAAVTSTPAAIAAGPSAHSAASAAAAAANRRRRSLSTEDVSGLELTDVSVDASASAAAASGSTADSGKRTSISPHPQVNPKGIHYYIISHS